MDKMIATLTSYSFGALAAVFFASGEPDLGWIAGAIGATIYIDRRIYRLEKKIMSLPCNIGRECSPAKRAINKHKEEDTTTT